MKKSWGLILLIFCAAGCSTVAVSSSTKIGTDAKGYAIGEYSDDRSGVVYSPADVMVGGGGGGGGGASSSGSLLFNLASKSAGSSGIGLGMGGVRVRTGTVQTEGDPMKFARAIALINYTRSLANESTCSSKQVFDNRPIRQKDYQPFGYRAE